MNPIPKHRPNGLLFLKVRENVSARTSWEIPRKKFIIILGNGFIALFVENAKTNVNRAF